MAELDNMFVLKEFRGKGIGTKLISSFLDWCKHSKYDRVCVSASAQNTNAIKFYRKFGFKDYVTTLELDFNSQ